MLLKNSQHYDNKRRYYFLNNIKSNYKVFSFNIIGSKNWGLARNIFKFYSMRVATYFAVENSTLRCNLHCGWQPDFAGYNSTLQVTTVFCGWQHTLRVTTFFASDNRYLRVTTLYWGWQPYFAGYNILCEWQLTLRVTTVIWGWQPYIASINLTFGS